MRGGSQTGKTTRAGPAGKTHVYKETKMEKVPTASGSNQRKMLQREKREKTHCALRAVFEVALGGSRRRRHRKGVSSGAGIGHLRGGDY